MQALTTERLDPVCGGLADDLEHSAVDEAIFPRCPVAVPPSLSWGGREEPAPRRRSVASVVS